MPREGSKRKSRNATIPCLAFLISCLAGLAALTYFFTTVRLIIAGSLVAIALGALGLGKVLDRWALHRFREAWRRRGRDVLIVTSDSPHWCDYIEEHWIHRWQARAVLLNWSERKSWESRRAEVRLYRRFAGGDQRPLVIVVPEFGSKPAIVRFWEAFQSHKHGHSELLKAREAELEAILERGDSAGLTENDEPTVRKRDH